MRGGRPFKRTTVGDFYVNSVSAPVTMLGAKLVAGGAAATAEIQDANGTTVGLLSAPANGADWQDVPALCEGKVTLAAISGAGATVLVWVD